MNIKDYAISPKLIMMVVGVLLVVLLLLWGPAACRNHAADKKAAEVAAGQADAMGEAGGLATNRVSEIMEDDQTTDRTVSTGRDEIHAAPEAQRGTATQRAACRLKAYRDLPRCKELNQ